MPKVIYIAALGRSGVTLLDLLLSQHPRVIGLGEVVNVMGNRLQQTRERRARCSCGKEVDACSFWQKAIAANQSGDEADLEQQYRHILQTAAEMFGQDCLIVDQSKGIGPLQRIKRMGDIELKVLHLIKDVRAYCISRVDRAGKIKSRQLNKAPRGLPLQHFWGWYRYNRRMRDFLDEGGYDHLQLGYEEICHYPELMRDKLCEFIGISPEMDMLHLDPTKAHIITGNAMRHDPEKRRIRYDNRWFYRREWAMPALLLPHVTRFNRREVYTHTAGELWNR